MSKRAFNMQDHTMELEFAFVGLTALAGAAVSGGAASAMSLGLATNLDVASNIERVRLVCDRFGRCFRSPGYAYGYGPRFATDRALATVHVLGMARASVAGAVDAVGNLY